MAFWNRKTDELTCAERTRLNDLEEETKELKRLLAKFSEDKSAESKNVLALEWLSSNLHYDPRTSLYMISESELKSDPIGDYLLKQLNLGKK